MQVTFSAPGLSPIELDYDLLVGADGTGSRVRTAMQVSAKRLQLSIC